MNINKVLQVAIDEFASDVHLIYGLKPIIRVARDLVEVESEQKLDEEDLFEAYDYFVRGNVNKDEIYKETKRIDTSFEYNNTRLRVNISSSEDIPTFTVRIIRNDLPTFDELGVPEIVRRMTSQLQGLILVTGKTNSGKTTTLNALVNDINQKQNKKILALEKPVEYKHTSDKYVIIQKEVGRGADIPNFRDGVINALREDCDILIIGEIRDKETMEAAIDMAESGHLVIRNFAYKVMCRNN
jgi:twitching motility protein PilT